MYKYMQISQAKQMKGPSHNQHQDPSDFLATAFSLSSSGGPFALADYILPVMRIQTAE